MMKTLLVDRHAFHRFLLFLYCTITLLATGHHHSASDSSISSTLKSHSECDSDLSKHSLTECFLAIFNASRSPSYLHP